MNPLRWFGSLGLVFACGAAALALDTPPQPLDSPHVAFPRSMARYRMDGHVTLRFTVDAHGDVTKVFVVDSNNPGFEDSAIDAMRRFKYAPARHDGVPVAALAQRTLTFGYGLGQKGNQPWVTNGGQDLPKEYRFDVAPVLQGMIQPVYPYSSLLHGNGGDATVAFMIGTDGHILSTRVVQASQPEYGQSLVAAVANFRFVPAKRDGKPVATFSTFHQTFDRSMPVLGLGFDEIDANGEMGLASNLDRHPERLVPASRLDAPVHPFSQRPAIFPPSLKDLTTEGKAVVRVVIDSRGLARLPRVISATDPAFGYSAVQAAQYWRFDPPHSGGKTVTTIVDIPFTFALRDHEGEKSVSPKVD